MDFALFLLAFTMFWKMTLSIRCYKCEPERLYDNSRIPLCEHFNGGEEFITDCPYSTVCSKKVTVLQSLGLTAESVQRGCALQTMDGEQEKVNGHWRHVKTIHEVYSEACEEESNESGRATRTTHCYCRGELCNGAGGGGGTLALVLAALAWGVVK